MDEPLRRVLREAGDPALTDKLAGLSGTALTTLLLEVQRRQASRLSAVDVMRRYGSDRFVAPAAVDFAALRRAEDAMLAALPAGFDVLTLAPVLPLGAHSAVATVDPRKVVANLLFAVGGLGRLGAVRVRLELTRLDDAVPDLTATVEAAVWGTPAGALAGAPGGAPGGALAGARFAEVVDAPGRSSGRGYYTGLCFKVQADFGAGELEVGDGGFVDWTGKLLGNRKERLLISGYGIDRIAATSGG